MKLNLGMGGGTSEGANFAGKNGKVVWDADGIRVIQYKGSTYWKFFVYRTDIFPKEEKDPERFGREFFNQQDAQKSFNAIKTTNNIIKLPNR